MPAVDDPEPSSSSTLDLTGIPALDQVLGGGVPRGALALVLGAPGSGKTTLAGQIAFATARAGHLVLFLTALSEATSKLVTHLRGFTYFDESFLGEQVQIVSLQAALQKGQVATKNAVVEMVRHQKPRLVVLDGFQAIRGSLGDLQHARQFMYELSTMLHTLGVTLLITSEITPHDPTFFPESTAADVIIGLHCRMVGVRQYRGLEIIKTRETMPLSGIHTLQLGSAGVHIALQLEERIASQSQSWQEDRSTMPATDDRMSMGLDEVDAILFGGLPRATSTALLGTTGVGKTLLGLSFLLHGVQHSEPTLLVSLRETLAQVRRLTAPFALAPQLQAALQPDGGLHFLHAPALKLQADVFAEQLFARLDQFQVQRLVLDDVEAVEQALKRAGEDERLDEWWMALLMGLQQRGVTSLLTKGFPQALATGLDVPADPLTVLADNVLVAQQIVLDGQFHRVLAPLKMRYSPFDRSGRLFAVMAPAGLEVFPLDNDALQLLAQIGYGNGARSEQSSSAQRTAAKEEP